MTESNPDADPGPDSVSDSAPEIDADADADAASLEPNTVHHAEASAFLRSLPPDSVDTVVTSPPYWGLRDYNIDGQAGVERDAEEYVDTIVTVCNEIRRVLTPEGSLWLNLGDTYNGCSIVRPDAIDSHTRKGEDGYEEQLAANRDESGVWRRSASQYGYKRQSRLFLPHRVATRLCAAGWRCRDRVIWVKSHPKPEGRVSTRLTRAHEPVFRFVTEEGATFDRQAVTTQTDVWEFPTATVDHPAPFPIDLPKRALTLTTEQGDLVADPFCGSGTTLAAAKALGRQFIGCDLNPEYVAQAQARTGITIDNPDLLTDDTQQTLTEGVQ